MSQPWQILKRAAFGGPLTSEQVARNLGATQPTDGVTPASTEQSKWKLVPVESTDAMLKAGGHANSEWLNDIAPIGEARYVMPMKSVWRDMIAAAPSPVVGRNELLTAIETYLDAQDTLNNHDTLVTSLANILVMWDRVHRARTQLNIAIKELK